jgi:hypothetical protein
LNRAPLADDARLRCRLDYRLQGPGEDFFHVRLAPDGRYRIEVGGFRSVPPRIGRVDPPTAARLQSVLDDLAPLSSWSYGAADETGYAAELRLGEAPRQRLFRWSGRPVGRPAALVRLASALAGL